LAINDGLQLPNREFNNLAVIVVDACGLKGIQEALQQIVDVASAMVRRTDIDLNDQWPLQWTKPSQCQERTHAFAKYSPLATDERPCSNPPPVMIHRRRVRQIELQFHDRFHGATLEAAAAAIGGAEDSFFA
jgi:hypothetical protein